MAANTATAPKQIRRMQIARESELPKDACQTPGTIRPCSVSYNSNFRRNHVRHHSRWLKNCVRSFVSLESARFASQSRK